MWPQGNRFPFGNVRTLLINPGSESDLTNTYFSAKLSSNAKSISNAARSFSS